jgi:peptidyl-prolyl cis-trans isomerase B (cyclophilin B)
VIRSAAAALIMTIALGAHAQSSKSAGALSPQGQSANPKVELKTSKGSIVIELYSDKAPKTTANFLQYVKDGQYDGTVFHRVISGFMIQGGGFDSGMIQKPTKGPVPNEADNGLKNDLYTVAMARTSDPQSATAQFFINVANNAFLNYTAPTPQGWGYCVFGRVVEGQSVVDAIARSPTHNVGFFQNVPVDAVVIEHTVLVTH